MEKEPLQPLNPLNIDQSLEQISRRMQAQMSGQPQFTSQNPQDLLQYRFFNKLHGQKCRNSDDQSQEEIVTSDQVKKLQENINEIRKFAITHGKEIGSNKDDPFTRIGVQLKENNGSSSVALVAYNPTIGLYRGEILKGCELSFLFSDPRVYCWFHLEVDKKVGIDIQDNNPPSFPIYKVNARIKDINQEEYGVVSYCVDKINGLIETYNSSANFS